MAGGGNGGKRLGGGDRLRCDWECAGNWGRVVRLVGASGMAREVVAILAVEGGGWGSKLMVTWSVLYQRTYAHQ